MLLARSRRVQLFGFSRGPGRFKPGGRGSFPAWGVALRVADPRGTGRWRHIRLRLGWWGKNDYGRGVCQAEADTWLTANGTSQRCAGKTFLRIKAGSGRRYDA